ncbi:MAG TPA: type II secretion system protein [Thermoleophilia bacterium]|nr:type II secretion system protein [Thermoleophilia bacterium]
MRSPHSRHLAARCRASGRRSPRGFTMIELLVSVVIAAIVFAAMIPFFANALSRTSEDEIRVDANSIAQDRIEQIRLLSFSDILQSKLNTPPATPSPFGDGRFGPSYTLYGEVRPYSVHYYVTPTPDATSLEKYVEVTVSRADSNYIMSAHTIVKDPEAGTSSVTDAEPTNLTLTVYFDTYQYVVSPGVTLQRVQTNVTPNVTTSPTPDSPPGAIPNATYPTVKFSNLTGGPNYTYTVSCKSSKATYVMVAPPFRLWSTGTLKFDTYPGGD